MGRKYFNDTDDEDTFIESPELPGACFFCGDPCAVDGGQCHDCEKHRVGVTPQMFKNYYRDLPEDSHLESEYEDRTHIEDYSDYE